MAQTDPHSGMISNITIDGELVRVSASSLTGAQLRGVPHWAIGWERDLFLEQADGSNLKVGLKDLVDMRDGLRFITAPKT